MTRRCTPAGIPWRILAVLALAGLWGAAVGPAQGQELGRIEEMKSSGVPYYYFVEPGKSTVQISLWGEINSTGFYEVTDTTSLARLLTMASGPDTDAQRWWKRPTRITVKQYRPRARKSLIFEAQVDEILRGEAQHPPFKDDDILVVEKVDPVGIGDVVGFLFQFGSLVFFTDRLINFFRDP